jgi:small subunit ribosomal protein S17
MSEQNKESTTARARGDHGRPQRQGVVTSNKMAKTIVVEVERLVRHPIYGKFVRRSTKLYAHDEKSEAAMGDVVDIEFGKPMSKLKRWRLVRVVRKGSAADPVPGAVEGRDEVTA